MVHKGTSLYRALDHLADAVIPILAIVLLVLLIRGTIKKEIDWRWWAAALLGIAAVYIVKAIDDHFHLWKSFGSDYSSHSACTLALLVPLMHLRSLWKTALAAVFVAYAILMIVLKFHTPLDIISTLIVVVPLLWLVYSSLLRQVQKPAANL